jgi:hypothetical protein
VIYLIIFACYGCHLHGNEPGSVDREHNVPGTPNLEADGKRAAAAAERMVRPLTTWTRSGATPYGKRFRRCVGIAAARDGCGNRSMSRRRFSMRNARNRVVAEQGDVMAVFEFLTILNRSVRQPLPDGRGSDRRYTTFLHFYVAHPR